ncbi:hypothetical protein VitviT2T_011691 [Vitis vinifera]|uniref:Uncharacterized protein n=1 Tax=Vitis vinifera TaxID=29760 RepID=A0ABY9CD99_VITVI|nr:hypothetical protein VitviT2T_011691 [Vitis vinifera]
MPKTRGGHTSAPQSSERAAPVRAPLDAPPHLADSASQSRYHTRRASTTPVAPTQIPPRGPPTKKAKTSGPGGSSYRRAAHHYPWFRVPCLACFFSDSDHYSGGHYGAYEPLPDSAGPTDSHSP